MSHRLALDPQFAWDPMGMVYLLLGVAGTVVVLTLALVLLLLLRRQREKRRGAVHWGLRVLNAALLVLLSLVVGVVALMVPYAWVIALGLSLGAVAELLLPLRPRRR